MTEAVLRLVGKITPPCPLDSYWRTSGKSDILSGGVMANRPHQSIIYRITDADTPGAQKTEGSLWEVHIAQISLQTWSGRRGGVWGWSNLVIFWPWEIRVTLLNIGTIHGLALECLGGMELIEKIFIWKIFTDQILTPTISADPGKLLLINKEKSWNSFQHSSLHILVVCYTSQWERSRLLVPVDPSLHTFVYP